MLRRTCLYQPWNVRREHQKGRINAGCTVSHALFNGFGTSENRLSRLFLLSTSLIPRLSLFLVGQGGQSARDLPNLNIPQRIGKFLGMGLDKGSIQWLVLMLLDDEFEDLAGENDEILFGLRVGFQDRFDVDLRACIIERSLPDMRGRGEIVAYQRSRYQIDPQHSSYRFRVPSVCPSEPLLLDPKRHPHRTIHRRPQP